MTMLRILPATLITLAVLAACNTTPRNHALLEEARSDYRAAQGNPQAVNLAGGELKQAGDALNEASAAWARRDEAEMVDHLAYLAKQRVAIAQEVAKQKTAELAVTQAETARDKVRLTARTNEAQTAQRDAQAAQEQADTARRQTADAQARTGQLQTQLQDLQAQQTQRGLVVTLGDVLFDTNNADLGAGGMRSVDRLVDFLVDHPKRKALVEGFTDSVGSEATNRELSGRRAAAVAQALVGRGIDRQRVATQGYGEAYPVAANDSASGRRSNRRVEIVISDDSGSIVPR